MYARRVAHIDFEYISISFEPLIKENLSLIGQRNNLNQTVENCKSRIFF